MSETASVALRRTTSGDFGELRRLFDHPSLHGWGGQDRLSDEQIRAKYLGSRYPDVECYLVVLEGQAVGLVQLHVAEDGAGGGIDLVLLSEVRGQGIGRRVVNEMVLRARQDRGWSRITVDPEVRNESGVSFWRAVGFKPERVVADEPGRAPYWLMAWPKS